MPNLFSGDAHETERMICTPSAFARERLLTLQELGTLRAKKRHASSRRGLSSYLFIYVVSGAGSVTYCGQSYEMHAGDCCFFDCMEPYSHRSWEELWTIKWIHMDGAYLDALYTKYTEQGGKCCFPAGDVMRYEYLWKTLWELAASDRFEDEVEISARLSELLAMIARDGTVSRGGIAEEGKRRDIGRVRDYLNSHYMENIRLEELASRFFISKFYLTHIFREQYGVTINAYLTRQRIIRAKELLRFSEGTVEQIGAACGYADVNYFIRVFKRAEGMTPREWRTMWRNKSTGEGQMSPTL